MNGWLLRTTAPERSAFGGVGLIGWIVACCAASCLASAPPLFAAEVPPLKGPSPGGIYEAKLDNGLEILIKEVHTAPIVCASIWYRAGSKHETGGQTGLAHLLEHMMFKGTAKHGKGEYDRALEENGGLNNATTWLDRTNYYAAAASDKLDLLLELEADRVRGALFTEADLVDEMPVVRNEMEKGEDDPQSELDERIGSMAILEHPYHWPTIGWKSDVEAIRAEDIRGYYDKYYWPNNAFLLLVGDVPANEMLEKAAKHFADLPSGGEAPRVVTVEPPQKGERRFLIRERGETRILGMAYRMPEGSHPDQPALAILGTLMASGRASRLYRALVDTGLATDVQAYPQRMADPYLFFVYVTLTPEADPDAVEEALDREVARLQSEAPEAKEIARALKLSKVQTAFSRDDVIGLMFEIGEAETYGDYMLFERALEELGKVTPADVQRVASTYLIRDSRTVGFYLPLEQNGGSWTDGPKGGRSSSDAAPDADDPGGAGLETGGSLASLDRTASTGGMMSPGDLAIEGSASQGVVTSEGSPRIVTTEGSLSSRIVPIEGSSSPRAVISEKPASLRASFASSGRRARHGDAWNPLPLSATTLLPSSTTLAMLSAVPSSGRGTWTTPRSLRNASPPDPATGSTSASVSVSRKVLSNGITLLVQESRENPTVALEARIAGGLLAEAKGKEGVAALTAELLPLGTIPHAGPELAELLEASGIDVDLHAESEAVVLEARSLAEDFPMLVSLVGEILRQPRFEAEQLALAKERLESERAEKMQDTYVLAHTRAFEEVYGQGSPYARIAEGTESSLAGLERDDVTHFHGSMLQAARWTFAVVGDVSASATQALFEEHLGAVPAGTPLLIEPATAKWPENEPLVVRLDVPDKSQVDLVFVGEGVRPTADEYYAAIVANSLVGGMFTSRLNATLRDDEGLTYGAGSEFEQHRGASVWSASLGVNPENLERALASTKREIARIHSDLPSDEEVARAISYTAGSYPIRMRSKSRIAHELLEAEWLGLGPNAVPSFGDRLRQQSPEAVRSASGAFADAKRLVVVVAGTLSE